MFQKAHKLTFNQRLAFQFPSTISKRTRTRFVETKSKHEHRQTQDQRERTDVHICLSRGLRRLIHLKLGPNSSSYLRTKI